MENHLGFEKNKKGREMSGVIKQRIASIAMLLALVTGAERLGADAWPSNARNDPFPPHTSVDPHTFLYEREKQLMFGMPDEKGTPERVMISLSPFGQNATKAKTLAGTYCKTALTNPCDVCTNPIFIANQLTNPTDTFCMNEVELGDIDGRWNLLGLLAGQIPQGATVPPLLLAAFGALFPGVQPGTITAAQIKADPCDQRFGYVSAPLKYRKRGIRWDVEAQICGDFGLQFLGGVVEISQVLNPCFVNLTGTGTAPCILDTTTVTAENIACFLFDPLVPLLQQLGLNVCNFTKWGIEDLYLALYWRHAHVINFNRDLSWARFLLIPFFRIGGSFATGHIKDPSVQFSLPFGNNGSPSICANAGMNFDFAETVEIGAEVGYAHFFKKDFENYRLPTNVLQSSIFPYATNVSVQPGDSAYVAAKLSAYHFLDRMSFCGRWIYVHHRRDQITPLSDDPAFISAFTDADTNNPFAKCPNTAWRVQLANFALTYDLSPNIAIGFIWQQPLHVRNAYNSTTAMFTLNLIF